jgi:hypothetical protein
MHISNRLNGSVATLTARQEPVRGGTGLWFLGVQPEQRSDDANLRPNIIAAHPSNLAFPNHVHRLIALKRSPGGMEFRKPCLALTRRLIAR